MFALTMITVTWFGLLNNKYTRQISLQHNTWTVTNTERMHTNLNISPQQDMTTRTLIGQLDGSPKIPIARAHRN